MDISKEAKIAAYAASLGVKIEQTLEPVVAPLVPLEIRESVELLTQLVKIIAVHLPLAGHPVAAAALAALNLRGEGSAIAVAAAQVAPGAGTSASQ